MKIAVITPYYREDPEILKRCLDSVKAQTVACEHFLVADGFPQQWVTRAGVRHIALDQNHSDYGNTPRGIGAQLAISSGVEAVAFLDADNWYDPDHLEACIAALKSNPDGYDLIAAKRKLIRKDGRVLNVADEKGLVDTNCYFILRSGFSVIPVWNLMPQELSGIGDRIFLQSVHARGLRIGYTSKQTVNYLTMWRAHYRATGSVPPPDARLDLDITTMAGWSNQLSEVEKIWLGRILGFNITFK